MKAQRLHDKMQTNLAMAKDRLNFLGEHFSFTMLCKVNFSLLATLSFDVHVFPYDFVVQSI